MSTHRHLKTALEQSIQAHRKAHADHLAQANLQEFTDDTVSPLGPLGDLGGGEEADNG